MAGTDAPRFWSRRPRRGLLDGVTRRRNVYRKKRQRRARLPRDTFISVRTQRRATHLGGHAQASLRRRYAAPNVLREARKSRPAAVNASYIIRRWQRVVLLYCFDAKRTAVDSQREMGFVDFFFLFYPSNDSATICSPQHFVLCTKSVGNTCTCDFACRTSKH